MITWPALVKYLGDNELVFVANQAQWREGLDSFHYVDGDVLVDSKGIKYQLTERVNDVVVPRSLNETLKLSEMVDMVRAHVAESGMCCASKFSSHSIEETIRMVEEITRQSDTSF